jgi:hypothetical protein
VTAIRKARDRQRVGTGAEEWLDRTDQTLAYYLGVRDIHAWKAFLKHRDGGCRLRRQSLGRHLPGHLPLSRPLGRLALRIAFCSDANPAGKLA